jgi:hypothetical protein
MRLHFVCALVVLGSLAEVQAQPFVPRVANRPTIDAPPVPASDAPDALRANSFAATKAVAAANHIVLPMPISATEKENALDGIDKHIGEELGRLHEKLNGTLPDELSILAKTGGWGPEDQQRLLTALRANDPPAVFSAWTAAAPQDTAIAELVARQTDARRMIGRLEQDAEKKQSALRQDLTDLDTALGKISAGVPGVAELAPLVGSLKNWIQARELVEAAVPGKGTTAELPKGKINLIYDPSLNASQAIVLNNESMLLGNQGHGPLMITRGNAAEALGLPIVTGDPLPDAGREEMNSGILLLNHFSSRGTITYNLDGNKYIMEPGMGQRLPDYAQATVDFDRGGGFGPVEYTVKPGTFTFTPTDEGWQLYRERFDVVLDNSQSRQEFNFVFNGRNQTIPAGATQALSSDYPVVIGYDRGNDGDFAIKLCQFSGIVQIGVNATDNKWDLFPTTDNQRENAKLKLFR